MRISFLTRTSGTACGSLIAVGFLAVFCSPLSVHADAPAIQPQPAAQPAAVIKPADQAAKLVQQALEAEAAGKPAERDALLKQALAIVPDYAPAHWQSGELKSGNAWASVDETAKHDAHSAKLDEYRQLRDQAAATVDDQLNLARWCEKAGLKEQQRAHLMFVLELQPNNKEAISKLGLVRYLGQLVPKNQLEDAKAKVKQSFAESQEWKTRVAGWRKQLQDHPNSSHDDLLRQIRAIRDPAAIPSLERTFANNSNPEIGKAVVDCLAAMPQQLATESLVRFALFSPYDNVMKAATYALKSRSQYSYMPLLLSAMKMPIHAEYDVLAFDFHNFSHCLDLFREGPGQDDEYVLDQKTSPPTSVYGIGSPTPGGVMLSKVTIRFEMENTVRFQQQKAASMVKQVDDANAESAQFNHVLAQVLQMATDKDLGDNPESWWTWWADQNDYYEPPENPVNLTADVTTTTIQRVRTSCFPAGTPVWTMSGPMQIEKIKVGELVLAQDAETGELAYKPVIGTTIRPSSPVIETKLGETQIRSTRGHPFWVNGIGWQMAKELKAGQWLHTAQGMVQIDSAEPSEDAVCYNLVVSDFHDYFVSGAKVLVHDNLLRGPTLATVPGLAEK